VNLNYYFIKYYFPIFFKRIIFKPYFYFFHASKPLAMLFKN
jgi:hypothetical protein